MRLPSEAPLATARRARRVEAPVGGRGWSSGSVSPPNQKLRDRYWTMVEKDAWEQAKQGKRSRVSANPKPGGKRKTKVQ